MSGYFTVIIQQVEQNPITLSAGTKNLKIWYKTYSAISKQSGYLSETVVSDAFNVPTGGPIIENEYAGETMTTTYSHSMSQECS